MIRVLELGNYVVPAYAGMILAEQGFAVEKWVNGRDPILALRGGAELWAWVNHRKTLPTRHPRTLAEELTRFRIVIDNFRPATLAAWGLDPAALAERYNLVWVSMRSEVGDRSFDLIAQARAWGEFCPPVPFWIGDTAGGLWLAFKALAMFAGRKAGHFVLGQSSCLQKLVEGELVVPRPEPEAPNAVPWEHELYFAAENGTAVVEYKGAILREPARDRAWKMAHLWHDGTGRITI